MRKPKPRKTRGSFWKTLSEYLSQSVLFHEPSITFAGTARTAIKWLFDLLRNILIVGLLLFFAVKTGNAALKVIAFSAEAVLFIYIFSYLDTWYLRPFHFMKNQVVATWLNMIISVSVVGSLSFGVVYGLSFLVNKIAIGYAN